MLAGCPSSPRRPAAGETFRFIYETKLEESVHQKSVIASYRYGITPKGLAYAYSLLERVKADRKGVTAMEYGVIAAGIVIAVAAAATTVGNDISALFTSIGGSL